MHKQGIYEKYIKRPQDIVLSLAGMAALSPAILATALLVRIKLGEPVIFRQPRPGRIDPKTGKEQVFHIYKFRSMTEETDHSGQLLPEEKRLTPFGRMLRESSLDELPELFNILKGDMSLVGPRPLLVRYLGRYDAHQRRRHEVRPGLTGLAQVNGRNAISWEEKFAYDTAYVDHVTFVGDWKILFRTIRCVLGRKGIHSGTSATMEDFKGKMGSKRAEERRS